MVETAIAVKPARVTATERKRRNQALIALLDSWMDEDAQEQRDTFEFLRTALDEDRPRSRRLFPRP